MQIKDFQDAVVTVMGLGRFKQGSGVGATKWLMRHGAQVIITDLKSEEELKESVNEIMHWYEHYRKEHPKKELYHPLFVLGEHREEDFTDVQYILQNPDVPRESKFVKLARENNVPIFTDTTLFFTFCPYPIVAVTGSKGKSTTTALIAEIFKATDERTVTGGNIKVSPLEFLDDVLADPKPRPIVLELSSFMLDALSEISRRPDIGVLTNVFPDHLNRYKDFAAYKHSKEVIFDKQTADQIMILNYDREEVREMEARVPSKLFWYSKQELPSGKEGCFIKGGNIIAGGEEIIATKAVKLAGEHNLENVLAAVCATKAAKVTTNVIGKVLKEFSGVKDRQEIIREIGGVEYVNDTTATNPDAAIAALKRFGQKAKVVLIAGGASKGLSFQAMAKTIQATCNYVVLLEGTGTDSLRQAIGDAVPTVMVKSMKEAVEVASSVVREGETILMSPGTSSFGMFKNEFDRGDQFKAEVKKLK